MSTLPEVRRFTVGEYVRLAEVGVLRPDERVELIGGQIVAMSPQGPVHSALVSRIVARLVELFPRERYCVRPQCTLIMGESEAPEPDVAVVAGPCEAHERELPRSALLVVEVAETSLSLDRGRKAQLYATGRVPEYWVVDVAGRTLEVHRDPSAGGFRSVRVLRAGDAVLPLALEAGPAAALPVVTLLPSGR